MTETIEFCRLHNIHGWIALGCALLFFCLWFYARAKSEFHKYCARRAYDMLTREQQKSLKDEIVNEILGDELLGEE